MIESSASSAVASSMSKLPSDTYQCARPSSKENRLKAEAVERIKAKVGHRAGDTPEEGYEKEG